jgi:hypothetical protein
MTTELKPLKISCTASDCDEGLHCFKATQALIRTDQRGACRSCGANLIDWVRVHDCNLDDVDFTFASLEHEFIRHHFWHEGFDEKALNHARRKGRTQLYAAALHRLEKSVGHGADAFDGRQTPFKGNTIYFAQHAVAACCRTCIEYWHGIERDRSLNEQELSYLHGLVVRFLQTRLPELPDEPQKVPVHR